MELKKHYNDDNFHYSCPECREDSKKRKRDKKELRKRQPSYKSETKLAHKRRCTENNSSDYSNCADNEAQNFKSNDFSGDALMANANSQLDEEMVEDSYSFQTDNGQVVSSELDPEGVGQNGTDSRKGELKKRKQVKKNKNDFSKLKKSVQRPTEDNCSNGYQRNKESLEEFTKERSMRIARERIDIVESRSL